MNATDRYLVHLEMVIWASFPKGTRLNSKQIAELMAKATPEQKQAALVRGVDHEPLIFPDEEIDVNANKIGFS